MPEHGKQKPDLGAAAYDCGGQSEHLGAAELLLYFPPLQSTQLAAPIVGCSVPGSPIPPEDSAPHAINQRGRDPSVCECEWIGWLSALTYMARKIGCRPGPENRVDLKTENYGL